MSVIPSWAKVGAKVVCIKHNKWFAMEDGTSTSAGILTPRYGEIVEIVGFDFISRECFIAVSGYGDWYFIRNFRPLVIKSAEDDIAMFLSLLRPADPIELAEAMLETSWENGR